MQHSSLIEGVEINKPYFNYTKDCSFKPCITPQIKNVKQILRCPENIPLSLNT